MLSSQHFLSEAPISSCCSRSDLQKASDWIHRVQRSSGSVRSAVMDCYSGWTLKPVFIIRVAEPLSHQFRRTRNQIWNFCWKHIHVLMCLCCLLNPHFFLTSWVLEQWGSVIWPSEESRRVGSSLQEGPGFHLQMGCSDTVHICLGLYFTVIL